VIIIDVDGYWGPLQQMIAAMTEGGFVRKEHAALFIVVPGVEEAFEALDKAPAPRFGLDSKHL
jgi:predicted Rossmann-fold nucleotide-binding protein